MIEQKFKVGDKVTITRYSDSGEELGQMTYIFAKPLSDLWKDEKTCREIAELSDCYNPENPIESKQHNLGTLIKSKDVRIFISSSGYSEFEYSDECKYGLHIWIMEETYFFKLSQLLTERGYYPVE